MHGRRHLFLIVGALCGAPGTAAAEPLRPVTSTLGWQVDYDSVVQVDAVAHDQSSVDEVDPATLQPLNQETIEVRRALLRVNAHKDDVFAGLEIEANDVAGPVARLLGAQVGWQYQGVNGKGEPPLVQVAAGLLLVPFGVEVPTNLRDKTFLEVPTWAQAFFPGNYDGGARVRGAYGMVRWVIGMMDGAPSGDLQWKGRDPDGSYDFVGRIGGDVDLPQLWGRPHVQFGVSALTGKALREGTPATKDQLVWTDNNNNGVIDDITEITEIPGSPALPSVEFTHSALGADLMGSWCLQVLGTGRAWGEVVAGTNLDRGVAYADPVDLKRDLHELGFDVAVLQDLGPWGQVGVRYDRYDTDRDAQEEAGVMTVHTNQIYSDLALLASARKGSARVTVQYDHKRNPLGIADTGLPVTKLDDRLTVRGEVKF